MKKKELTDFLEKSLRWHLGAEDVEMPQPKDSTIAYQAMITLLRASDADVVDFTLRDFEFKYFGKNERI